MGTFTKSFPLWTKKAAEPQISSEHAGESQLQIALAGRRSMDDRNRELKKTNKRLFALACILGGALAVSSVVNLRYSGQSMYIPYVIQTDRTGRVLNAEVLQPSRAREATAFQTLITRELTSWVEDWRTVTTDIYAQQTLANHVFARLDQNGEAKKEVTEWYIAHDPTERAKKEHVEAHVQGIVPRSATEYEFYWQETAINITDQSKKISHWRCVITIATNFKNSDPAGQNADGLYIEHVSTPTIDKDSNE